MSGCVTVTGPPASICCLNFGTTEPFDASTLPKRTAISRIAGRRCARRANSASSAWQYISAKRLVAPSTDTGSIALSVEIITIAAAPAAAAASATFTEPNTLVLTPSPQSRSSSGTCLSAAAWNTMSGLNSANTPKMRSRSRTSAMRLSISAAGALGRQRLDHGVQRDLGMLHDHQPRRAERDRRGRRFPRRSSRRRR